MKCILPPGGWGNAFHEQQSGKSLQPNFRKLPWKYWSLAVFRIVTSFSNQGAENAFNKTIQIQFSAAFDSIIQEKIPWDFELNLWRYIYIFIIVAGNM